MTQSIVFKSFNLFPDKFSDLEKLSFPEYVSFYVSIVELYEEMILEETSKSPKEIVKIKELKKLISLFFEQNVLCIHSISLEAICETLIFDVQYLLFLRNEKVLLKDNGNVSFLFLRKYQNSLESVFRKKLTEFIKGRYNSVSIIL